MMRSTESIGRVQTVLGLIEPEELGPTLTHEHCFIDNAPLAPEPTDEAAREYHNQPVSRENLWWVRYHPFGNLDNIRLLDEDLITSELVRLKAAGGGAVVDMTTMGYGQDPQGLVRLSQATGLHIVMGAGCYIESTYPPDIVLDEDWLTERFVGQITAGEGGVRAGVLGQLGFSWPPRENERMVLRAAGRAQTMTGVALKVASGASPKLAFEALEILTGVGVEPDRISIDHVDKTFRLPETRLRLAETGCWIEYSLFGFEGWWPLRIVESEETGRKASIPSDAQRVDELIALIEAGYLDRLLVSHDHAWKTGLCRYGGPGYAHLLNNVVPLMRHKGMPEEHIQTLLVDNPGRFLRIR